MTSNIFAKLFSVKYDNDRTHKVYRILGIKVKTKTKAKTKIITSNRAIFKYEFYKSPIIQLDDTRPVTVNIFMPTINKMSITAGPLGILYLGKQLLERNINVRFLAIYNLDKNALFSVPELEILLNKAEFEDLSNSAKPTIKISKNDINVATLWDSAYTAKEVQSYCNFDKFIYMIQDYEPIFYNNSSNRALCENTYKMNFIPLFSTHILKKYFVDNNIGGMGEDNFKSYVFNTSASSNLLTKEEYFKINSVKTKKKLIFYGRPSNSRNAYELGMKIMQEAIKKNILDPKKWDFYSFGDDDPCKIYLTEDVVINKLPYMTVAEYKNLLPTFDLGLSLMLSPHPSMVPIDLALSGCPVITNDYANKNQEVLSKISNNILSEELEIDLMLQKIKEIIPLTDNLELRYKNAVESEYPQNWNEAYDETADLFDYIVSVVNKRD